jgi:hypothetical protein
MTAVSFASATVSGMAKPNATGPEFLTGAEVCSLLHIAKSTLPAWRDAGLLVGHQLESGQWRYRDDQPAIVRARAALAAPLRDAIPVGQLTLGGDE